MRESWLITTVDWILGALLIVPVGYVALASLYLTVLTLAAMFYRRPSPVEEAPLKMAVVIPAHNESEQILEILGDGEQLDYPKDSYAIFVIADNCDDDTAALAREAGATVFERHDLENRGKGQALDCCFREQRAVLEAYDVIALVDADMVLDMGFLEAMNRSFADERVQVVQGLNTVAVPDGHWRSAIGFMSFSCINHVRPAGRYTLGGTADLKGSGMAFRSALLLERGWPAHSLAEDAEFAKQLLFDGIKVAYNPDALVTSPIPTHTAQASVQQERWEGGKRLLVQTYFPRLLKRALTKPSVSSIDALLDILVPPVTVLGALTAGCLVASIWVHPTLLYVCLAALGGVAFHVLMALVLVRAPLKVWLYLGAVPLFLIWKAPLMLRVLLGKVSSGWQRTPRDNEVADKD